MKRSLELEGTSVYYTLKRPLFSRRLRILIKSTGDIVVTAPKVLSLKKIEEFLAFQKDWILEKVKLTKERQAILTKNRAQMSLPANSARARKLAHDRVKYFAGLYGVSYNSIRIKNQSTQWGSCSSKKNLNFNYKIVFLPPELADYVIVHEVCHLLEMNHSERFWKQVARTIPDYKTKKSQLRRIHLLH